MKPFDATGAFQPEGDGRELGLRAVRGAGVTVFSGGVATAIQMISAVILVRLLTPGDFGLIAMASTFSLLLMNFGVNGLTEAIIQREKIDHALVSNLFWINIGGGLLLTIAFEECGSLLARFYGDPRVSGVAVGMSVAIFITSTSVQHLALLKRAMRFTVVSANDVVARLVSVGVSILLAWAGWGYWALVAGIIATPLSTSIGAWYLCRWKPGLPKRGVGTRAMVWFATQTYGRFTVNYFSRNVDNLLVGWRFGAASLGFYKKAYDLFALPANQLVSPLTEVALSALSRLDPRSDQYRKHFLSALSILAFVGMGLAAGLTLVGKDIIRLLLGSKWAPAGRIFTFFGPGIGAMLIYYTHGWIHLSIGKTDRWLRWTIVEVTVTCMLFLLALPWGGAAVAVAWATSFWVLTIPALAYAGRPIGFGVGKMLAVVWKHVLAALLAGSVCAAIMARMPFLATASGPIGAAERLLTISLMLGWLYLIAVIFLHRGCGPLYELAELMQEMVPGAMFERRPQAVAVAAAFRWEGREAPTSTDNNTPLVSILIPAYNSQEWIADTLRSAIGQTWQRKEIIVVDDGSTDRTPDIARQFEPEGVRVVTQRNQGASAARNHAFSLSRGDYIQWLDADDLLAPDKIALQMAALQKRCGERTLLSSAFGRFNYRYHRAEFIPTSLWCDLSPADWLIRKLGQNVYMQTATWLVSRKLTEQAGPWDMRLFGDDDGEYFCRVLLASDDVRFVPEARVYYRAPFPNGLSYLGRSIKKIDAHWLSMRLHIGYLRSLDDSETAREACLKYLRDNFIYFYPDMSDLVEEMRSVAVKLGGRLEAPILSWKYSWILILFGWRLAKHAQILAPKVKWTVRRFWDKTLFRAQNRKLTSIWRGLGSLEGDTTGTKVELRRI